MIDGLIANVFPHRLNMHGTYAELAITGLPCEIAIPLVPLLDPNGGSRFDLLNNFRRGMVFGLREKQVNVVAHGIDFNQRRLVIFEDAPEIRVKLIAFLIAQQLTPPFCGEHEMHDDVGKRLRHDSDVLTGAFAGCKPAMFRSIGLQARNVIARGEAPGY